MAHDDEKAASGKRYSRRHVLRRLGVTGAALASGVAGIGNPLAETTRADASSPDNFGRIFSDLPPFAANTPDVRAALLDLGKAGGLMDAQDALEQGPILLITDPSLSLNNRNNPSHTAGTTFVGQFMDHDMTFDLTTRLGEPASPQATANVRTAVFDLDSIYGAGPRGDPQLYERGRDGRLKVESGGLFEDVPRGSDLKAIIVDERNDDHLIIAGLHAAFLLFHNNAIDYVRQNQLANTPDDVFDMARRLTTWHYHWMIVHEFLPLFVGQGMVDDIMRRGARFYRPRLGQAVIPVEFMGAAYRFGHSMVRPSYRANLAGDNGSPFFGMIFDPSENGKSDPDDLRAGVRAPRRFVGWQTFFDFGDGEVKPNKRIDTKISTPLFDLTPGTIPGPQQTPTSLPQRTFFRHLTFALPSGQDIARAMVEKALHRKDLRELKDYLDFDKATPLWYYVLKEAELMESGLHLGPVGGRLVGEVVIGLLQSDPNSYLRQEPDWTPVLPSSSGRGAFRMVDFLRFARVEPASRGQ